MAFRFISIMAIAAVPQMGQKALGSCQDYLKTAKDFPNFRNRTDTFVQEEST
jgi:hypothetical protein